MSRSITLTPPRLLTLTTRPLPSCWAVRLLLLAHLLVEKVRQILPPKLELRLLSLVQTEQQKHLRTKHQVLPPLQDSSKLSIQIGLMKKSKLKLLGITVLG